MIRLGPLVQAFRILVILSFTLTLIACGPPRGTAVLTKDDAVQAKEAHKAAHPPMKTGKKARASAKRTP